MGSWKDHTPKQLKKIVYALNDHNLKKIIEAHENRGWTRGSEVKEYKYGLGCLMIYKNRRASDATKTAN